MVVVVNMSRFVLIIAILWSLSVNPQAPAQEYHGRRLVNASLVAYTDAVAPGKPFTVGLLLKIAPDWHTYWQYSGDSGLPTHIDWTLPPGYRAGDIQWPLPQRITEDGDLQTYAYPNEVLLLVQITPPQVPASGEVTLKAKATWLVCDKVCVPGNGEVSLTLPVASAQHAANAELFRKYRDQLPAADQLPFTYRWDSQPGRAVLEIKKTTAPGDAKYDTATAALISRKDSHLDFFPLPAAGMVIDHPQISDSGVITVPITSGSADQLAGVVVLSSGTIRKGWYVPSKSYVPPPAPQSSTAASSLNSQPPASNFFHYLLLGFFGGMLLNIMPCVLPVITLKIYGFIHQAGQSRARIFELGLAYCAGVFAWFLGLASLIVVFGLNWSFQFQNKGFVLAMLVICLIFGLNLVGAFELLLPSGLNTRLVSLASKEGIGGAFVHGLFTTLLGSACTAPLLGPAIGFALSQPPVVIYSFFATIAAGMAFPYFLLTVNPAWMRFLPKPGMWMVRVKQVMGVLVLVTALWFGTVFYQQLNTKPGGFTPMLEEALKSGRTVFVDFTAAWCINCKVNERAVLNTSPVQKAFKDENVLFLKADWTNGDPDITKLLKQFGRAGVPAYVVYPAGSSGKPQVLPELLTQQIVLDAVNNASKKTSKP